MQVIHLLLLVIALALGVGRAEAAADASPPQHLRDTGLFVTGSTSQVRPGHMPFSPQYPLWSDGATKRRWLHLPPGTSIDASRPDAWEFPRGTRLWKEFSHGRPIETRYIERRADGSWLYATYVWNEDGSDAVLAPATGLKALAVAGAPDGRYEVPGRADCRACHEGAPVPVLGASALQLSPDRDPNAAHAAPLARSDIDLRGLRARGWLRNLPPALLAQAPRITAASATERAALGYLHANCGHCHNDNHSGVPVRLVLAQTVAAASASTERVLRSTVDAPGRYRPPGLPCNAALIAPGRPGASVLALRMRSRQPQMQMPPLVHP